ncbi:hypothetical protein TI39_contig593g00023 [Zymoseptoria brevis]|uniref:Uncharacterized protein n=1 Tax=Zymoseptoria brevis TaxID=1047168 RepID=A0A0F4GIU7_9PEZI|nr:hypothetical protein TI39_contig593g00023 [Zymoseptoria brevis]
MTKPRSRNCPTVHTTLQAIHRTNRTLKTRADQDALLRKLLHKHDPALDEAQVTAELTTYRRQLSQMLGKHGERDVRDKNYSIKAKAIHNLFVVGPVGMLDQSFLDTMDAFTDSGEGDEDAEGEDEGANGSEAMTGAPSKPFKSTPIKLKLHNARASSATAAPTRSRTVAGLGEDFDFEASEEDDNRAGSEPATPQSKPRPRSKLPARKDAGRDIKPLSETSKSHKRKASTIITIDDSEDLARPKSKQRLMAPVSNAAAEWAVPAGYTSARAQETIPGSSRLRAPIYHEETEDELLPAKTNIPNAHFGEMAGGKSKRRDRSSSEYEDDDETEPMAKRQKTMPHSTAPAKTTAPVTSEAVTKSKRRDRTTSQHDDNDDTEPMAKRQKTLSTLTAHAKETTSVASETSTPDLSAQHPPLEPAAVQSAEHPGQVMSNSPLSDLRSQIPVPETTAAPSKGPMAPSSLDASARTAGVPSEGSTAPPSLDASTQTKPPTPRADQEATTRKATPAPAPWKPYDGPVFFNDPVDGKWVSKRMEAAGDVLFVSAQSFCQANNIDPDAQSKFVPESSPELADLYEKMFGDEDWQVKLTDIGLQNEGCNRNLKQIFTLLGLFGTGIRSMVFESSLPWDFEDKMADGLGADLDIVKEVLRKFYRHNYDGFLRAVKEAQILKPEFQDNQVAAHARSLANRLTEILRPHFMRMQKGPPAEDPLDYEHWGKYLREAFSTAIIVKQMISISPYGPFHMGKTVIGRPLDRQLQRPQFEWGPGKALFACHGILPGLSREYDGKMIPWAKTLVMVFTGNRDAPSVEPME